MSSIVCIGELLVDMIGEAERSIKENPGFSKRAGGAPANVAVAASRLGADTGMAASVGDDEFGEFLVDKLRDEQVDTSGIRMLDQENTTLAFVALDEEARPHFIFYRGADEHISREQLDLDPEKGDVAHIGSLPFTRPETAENILEFARNTEATVSFDPNLREDIMDDSYGEALRELLENVDILTAAEDELEFFGGLEEVKREVDELVVTRGESGAELHLDGEKHSATPPDVETVDTTGAGDALTGAYLAYRGKGKKEALELAVEAAAISTTEKGAMSSLPDSSELE